jgi:AcrR family transcriptional regulator
MTDTEKRAAGKRGAGRPRTAVLSREGIVVTALDLIDEVGAETFSVNLLAARLGVRPSSLYNHIAGKDDLLAAVQEVITDAIDSTMFETQPWASAVAAWARSYREAFIGHPHAIPLFATSPVAGAIRTMEMYERVVKGFERAEWPLQRIIPAIVALECFILGSAMDAVAPPDLFHPGGAAEHVPTLAAAFAAQDRGNGVRTESDIAFETGLAAMIRGLADRHSTSEKRQATTQK